MAHICFFPCIRDGVWDQKSRVQGGYLLHMYLVLYCTKPNEAHPIAQAPSESPGAMLNLGMKILSAAHEVSFPMFGTTLK